jgi:hypothetical protein
MKAARAVLTHHPISPEPTVAATAEVNAARGLQALPDPLAKLAAEAAQQAAVEFASFRRFMAIACGHLIR